jgi:hypothetical protein
MTDEQASIDTRVTLTDLQQSRVDFARCDLEAARALDLGRLDAASLILVIEKLRGRLDDVLTLVDEVCEPPD